MALIEKFHVVAAEKTVAAGETIKEGQIVALDADGYVVLQGAPDSDLRNIPYGIAGDTKSTDASAMPGVYSGWQNRVSDYFDETKASGKMTVYHSGGEFATDQFSANVAATNPHILPGALLFARNGMLDTIDQDGGTNVWSEMVVARLITVDGAYPSGVPGTDINGDMALSGDNGNTYIEIKLLI